jgi:hypothetical protein
MEHDKDPIVIFKKKTDNFKEKIFRKNILFFKKKKSKILKKIKYTSISFVKFKC